MMEPRKKKTYLTIIAIGGAALAVDRCFLSHPTTVTIEAVTAADLLASERTPVAPSAAPEVTFAIPDLPFPRNLKTFSPRLSMRDVFAPPMLHSGKNLSQSSTTRDGTSEASSDDSHMSRAVFETNVQLNGVLIHEGLRIAVVGTTWIRIGQSHRGCTLARVSGNTARFSCDDGDAVLKVKTHTARADDDAHD